MSESTTNLRRHCACGNTWDEPEGECPACGSDDYEIEGAPGSRPASGASYEPTDEFVTESKKDPPPDARAQPCTTVDDPDMFFPTGRDPLFAEPAVALCRRCMVTRECLSYALLHDVYGVWGGTTERQRLALRERHQITALPMSLDAYFEESA